jgi:hypothetical protein
MLPYYEKEARERQATHKEGDSYLTENFPEGKGEARNKLGETIGVSGRYISEAKKPKLDNVDIVRYTTHNISAGKENNEKNSFQFSICIFTKSWFCSS